MAAIIDLSNASLLSDQPEKGKAWKRAFNNGCCPNCKDPEVPECVTKTQMFTRANQSESLVTTVTNRYCRCQNQQPVAGCSEVPNPVAILPHDKELPCGC